MTSLFNDDDLEFINELIRSSSISTKKDPANKYIPMESYEPFRNKIINSTKPVTIITGQIGSGKYTFVTDVLEDFIEFDDYLDEFTDSALYDLLITKPFDQSNPVILIREPFSLYEKGFMNALFSYIKQNEKKKKDLEKKYRKDSKDRKDHKDSKKDLKDIDYNKKLYIITNDLNSFGIHNYKGIIDIIELPCPTIDEMKRIADFHFRDRFIIEHDHETIKELNGDIRHYIETINCESFDLKDKSYTTKEIIDKLLTIKNKFEFITDYCTFEDIGILYQNLKTFENRVNNKSVQDYLVDGTCIDYMYNNDLYNESLLLQLYPLVISISDIQMNSNKYEEFHDDDSELIYDLRRNNRKRIKDVEEDYIQKYIGKVI
jgi:hypothetical protein